MAATKSSGTHRGLLDETPPAPVFCPSVPAEALLHSPAPGAPAVRRSTWTTSPSLLDLGRPLPAQGLDPGALR